jgi:hypothetical protein
MKFPNIDKIGSFEIKILKKYSEDVDKIKTKDRNLSAIIGLVILGIRTINLAYMAELAKKDVIGHKKQEILTSNRVKLTLEALCSLEENNILSERTEKIIQIIKKLT